MENELIKINVNNINGEEANCVSLRELHKGLEIKTRFNDWSKRMFEYGFVENVDFISVIQKRVTNNPKNPYTKETDYIITLDMAKEIVMMQRSDIGKQFRKYFIECEKRLKEAIKTPQLTKEQELALKIFNGEITTVEAYKELADIETKTIGENN